MNARNGLLRCLAGSSWAAYTSTLRTGTLALVYSAAEFASPAWCRSSHTRKLNVALNDTMRIITGCMRPTKTTFLPVLAGITPPDIRREARVANLTVTAKNNSDHLLPHKVTAPGAACPQRLVGLIYVMRMCLYDVHACVRAYVCVSRCVGHVSSWVRTFVCANMYADVCVRARARVRARGRARARACVRSFCPIERRICPNWGVKSALMGVN